MKAPDTEDLLETARVILEHARRWARERHDPVSRQALIDRGLAESDRPGITEFVAAIVRLDDAIAEGSGAKIAIALVGLGHAGRAIEIPMRVLDAKQAGIEAGVHKARAGQRAGGSKRAEDLRTVTPEMQEKMRAYYERGNTIGATARKFNVMRSTVRGYLKKTRR